MKEIVYKLLNPFHSILGHNQELIMKLRYKKKMGRKLDLDHPTLFHDKILWMEFRTDTSLWTELADKYLVRRFVEARVGKEALNELYGVYDSVGAIDYSRLPQSFVLKTNNGCASHIIVRDKATANLAEIDRKMQYFLNLHFGELTGQPHYTGIKPLIIAEKLMVQDGDSSIPLNDYKFNCFNGKPVCCHAFTNRQLYTHNVSEMIYDMDWNAHPEYYDQSNAGLHLSDGKQNKPACFDEMKQMAAKLSEGFPFVRVDLYDIDGRPVFGEMTFTPGLDTYYTLEFQRRLGDMIDLSLCRPKK